MKISEILENASAGASSSGGMATSMGGGNGFLNGGPGTVSRAGVNTTVQPGKKRKRKPAVTTPVNRITS